MKFPISAIRHVPGSATAQCEITVSRANAALFQKLAERALTLARGMRQFGARSLIAEDCASGLLVRYRQGAGAWLMPVRSVTFDCGSGRDPSLTLMGHDGASLRPSISRAELEAMAIFDGTEIALAAHERSCSYCGFTNDASASIDTPPTCAMCAKPAQQPAEAVAAA